MQALMQQSCWFSIYHLDVEIKCLTLRLFQDRVQNIFSVHVLPVRLRLSPQWWIIRSESEITRDEM